MKLSELLVAFALINVQYGFVDQEMYGIHRLVQLSITSWSSQKGYLGHLRAAILEDIWEMFPWRDEKTYFMSREDWKQSENLMPHVIALAKASVDEDEALRTQGALRFNLASYMNARGEYAEALQILESSPSLESLLDTKDAVTFLGFLKVTILKNMFAFDEAETLSLSLRDNLVGYCSPQDRLFIYATNNLANCLAQRCKYEQSEFFLREILIALEECSWEDNGFCVSALQNLGLVLKEQYKYDEADEILDLARTRFEPVLGADDNQILQLRHAQAVGLLCRGHYSKSSEALKTIHAEHEKIFAPQHPEAIRSLLNLAQSLQREGRYAESEPYLRRGLAWCFVQNVDGNLHVTLCMFRFALALTYLDLPDANEVWIKLAEMYVGKGLKLVEVSDSMIDASDEIFASGHYIPAGNCDEDMIQILFHLSGPEDPRIESQREKLEECRKLLAKEASAMDGTVSVMVESASE